MRATARPLALLLSLLLCQPATVAAREVEDVEAIFEELGIAEDVFQSAMSHAVGKRLRITGVDTHYLPRQGVLVSMNVVLPWIDVDQFTERSLDLSTEVETLHDVPELVAEIMAELNMAIAPYDPVVLDELRELREEQKVIRSAQRKLRSQLREARRAKNRADDDAEELDEHIVELEAELNALVDDYEALNADIDELYASLQERRGDSADQAAELNVDAAVAETACNYGDTFKSLRSQQYLTVAVRLQTGTNYYVFSKEDLNECRRGNITAERLLERAWHYRR